MICARRRVARIGWLTLALTAASLAVPGVSSGPAAAQAAPRIATVAGGLARGPTTAFFRTLTRVAISGSTMYATDYTFSVVRAIDLDTGQERPYAGTASRQGFYGDGGPATSAGLSNPTGIAVDPQGNLYIADTWNARVRKVSPSGTISTFAGGGPSGVRGDGGPATSADITPYTVAADGQGNVFIVDGLLVRKVDAAGTISTVVGGGANPLRDGTPATSGSLKYTSGLDVDPAGNLYLAEESGRQVWRVDTGGIAHLVRRKDGAATTAEWDYPTAVRAREDGTLLVATQTRVLAVDREANTTVVAGNGTFGWDGDGGPAPAAQLAYPTGIDIDAAGNLYIANSFVRKVDTTGKITRFSGGDWSTAHWDGRQAVDVELPELTSVAAGPQGTIYLAEGWAGRLRKVDAAGVVTTVAGGGATQEPAEGVPARSAAVSPRVVTVGPGGTVYYGDDRGQVFRIDQTGVLRHVAGKAGVPCYSWGDCAQGDGGPATSAQLVAISGLAVAPDGTVYVSDTHTSRIRRIDTSGIITTFAGGRVAGFAGDGGPATAAQLNWPGTIQLDQWGNLYVADTVNGRIRKIDNAGVITTVAGSGELVGPGDGGPATASALYPKAVAVDPRGNVFAADGNRIRMVDTQGTITTVAGGAAPGFWGDGGPAVDAGLTDPRALVVDASGGLLVADSYNHRVRRITGLADMRPPGAPQAWGWNTLGQVGGTAAEILAPTPSGAPEGFTKVAGGAYHSAALRADGAVWTWGSNVYAQLGDGGTADRRTPIRVGAPALSGVVDLSAGAYHTLARRSDGSVWTWGWNGLGQLGAGSTTNRRTPAAVPGLTGVAAVAGGGFHSLALKADGSVWAWGWNGFGQLGDGTTVQRNAPVRLPGLTDVVAIAGGAYHSLALKSDGSVWAWGWNGFGHLGDKTTAERHAPVRVPGLSDVVALSAGAYHNLAVKADGSLWSWGFNRFGQLGDGTTTDRHEPVRVAGAAGVREVRAGWFHNVLRTAAGSVVTWGLNHVGQLGDGTLTDRHAPVTLPGTRATAVSAGAFHSLLA